MMKNLYSEKLIYRYYSSPIGELLIAGNDEGLHLIGFPEGKGKVLPSDEWVKDPHCLPEVEAQLKEYFAGERKVFDLRLCPHGTEFQLQVLNALLQIPYGSTCSYVEIAQEIGRPKAVRAVGSANGRNPIPIIIPCHRVIGADGSLTGFGGGLPTKQFLLALEGVGQQSLVF